MKTRRLTTILTSAYLSAMLATSVAPIRSDATLAATIDPMSAQKALQSAVNGLNASGWMTASTAEVPPTTQVTPASIPANNPAPKADPVITEELMARLIKLARENDLPNSVVAKICKVLDLCAGTADMPLKLIKGDLTDASHFFALPMDPNSKDILILVEYGTPSTRVVEIYLTDKTGRLRAAAVFENKDAHLITNEKAADKFKAELKQFAKEAADLPPAGTAVAGNS